METFRQFAKKFLIPAATYTPLSGGRYRWNQGSGPGRKSVIVTRSGLKSHRAGLEKTNLARLQHQAPQVVKKEQLPKARIDGGNVRCPGCREMNWGRYMPGEVRCKHCGEKFEAVKYF